MDEKVSKITAEIRAELKPEFDQIRTDALAEGRAQGAKEERERIISVQEAALPGYEKEIAAMVADGKTTGEQAAKTMLGKHKEAMGNKLTEIRGDAIKPIEDKTKPAADGSGQGGGATSTAAQKDPEAMARRAREIQAERKAKGVEISNEESVKLAYSEGK